ncbi:hypothetical protein FIBSPDRAFT_877446 [Athelia psychrophila]|uniref:Uncharacterized protein n=1 Tax=Athelia psychrophila TaxID=1759441 RepID=A0A167VYS0_9AGAM|nr:hypothetical protein FIBSPDRAFT_877446 [Fibularhizoctonia sp. CBS 109695]
MYVDKKNGHSQDGEMVVVASMIDRTRISYAIPPRLSTKPTSTVDLPASRFRRLASASRPPPVGFQNTRDTHARRQRRILVRNTQKISWILHGAPAC